MVTTRTTRSASPGPAALPGGPSAPALLISVRDPAEARATLHGGAQVIDIKEPTRGPLGAADRATVEAIVRTIAGRAPVTVACGELAEHPGPPAKIEGVAAYKVGLASAPVDWGDRLATWRDELPTSACVVPAGYWDHRAADAPPPESVLSAAARLDGWMVLDTWDKVSGPLPINDSQLSRFMDSARERGVKVALAGGLTEELVVEAAGLGPTLLGVRGAACRGGRQGRIDPLRVCCLREAILRTKPLGLP